MSLKEQTLNKYISYVVDEIKDVGYLSATEIAVRVVGYKHLLEVKEVPSNLSDIFAALRKHKDIGVANYRNTSTKNYRVKELFYYLSKEEM